MKKFYLLLALVLMAGVVHAQTGNNPNFGHRANLTQAKKAPCNVYVATPYSWTEDNQLLAQIFNDVQGSNNIPEGETMASTYENFVIRVSGLSDGGVYSVQFLDENGVELHTFTYWKDDVHISPLRSLFSTDEINRIHQVRLIGRGNSGSLTLEEAYFISAYKGLTEKNENGVYKGFLDKDGIDIGNAYIDPSYLIRSNRLWVDIHPENRTFDIVCERGSQLGTLSFSLPYKTGIDMSEVTFTATDFNRTADVMNRFICDNTTVDLLHEQHKAGYLGQTRDVRKIYNSRYSAPFYDDFNNLALDGVNYYIDSNGREQVAGAPNDSACKHVNNMYWQAFEFDTSSDTEERRRVTCQDFCLTKNTIKARTTRKGLVSTDWTNPDNEAGFRDKNYPVRPYFKYITDNQGNISYDNEGNPRTEWSDVVRGDWNASNTYNYTDLSKYNKMRIIGSQNTQFVIRYATSLSSNYHPTYNVPLVEAWKEIKVKTDAKGEVNVDLDYLKAKDNSDKFCLQLILFDGIADLVWSGKGEQIGNAYTTGGLRETIYVNNIELFEGEGRLVDLVGEANPNNAANMYHVWNNDNNYDWQYATIVRWATTQIEGEEKFYQNLNKALSSGDLVWGTNGAYAENYADLTGYKAIRVYAQSGSFRFVFNTIKNSTDGTQIRKWDVATVNSENGYAELDISNYEYFHLNCIKVDWNSSTPSVTAIKLVEDEEADYIFYGNGSYGEQGKAKIDPTVEAATKDPTAKVIDTRARCNNMQVKYEFDIFRDVEHLALPKTANPNVLFIERTKQFRSRFVEYYGFNDSRNVEKDVNLIVPSNKRYDKNPNPEFFSEYFTSNNIELTDGYSFYAPKKIKADVAKYTRTFNNANVVNSVILPFAVDAGNNKEKKSAGFYKTDVTLESTATEGKVGILEEQDVKKGDWLLQFTKKTGTTEPNIPYLYAVTTGTGEHVFNGVATEEGKVIVDETPDVQVPAHLNMTNNLPNATDPTYAFYLRGVYEGTYLEHILFYAADGTLYRTPYMTVTPFRTIIKSPIDVTDKTWETDEDNYFKPSGNVKVVLAFNGDDSSLDINSLVSDGLFAEDEPIYNLAGQRVNTFDKGVYIVGGKKILVK